MKWLYTGLKLFKFHEGKEDPEIIRVLDIDQEKKRFSYMCFDGEVKRMSFKDAKSYKILSPDGILIFFMPKVADDIDVAVGLSQFPKTSAVMKTNEGEPYVVCRQLALDVFSFIANGGNTVYGASVSVDTCPANLDFRMFVDFNDMGYRKKVAVYLDDTIDTIMALIDQEKFDNALKVLYSKYSHMYGGFVQSLKKLLEENKFMYDFRKCFDILEVPFTIDESADRLSDLNTRYLESTLGIQMLNTYMVKYSKEINTREFNREFILVTSAADNYNSVYIVCYDKA